MALKVFVGKMKPEENDIDPRVKVRFTALVDDRVRLSNREIDNKLREKALEDSPGASLSDLIKKMVKEVAYGQARLSLTEFIQRFKKDKLADVIAGRFANSLFAIDTDEHLLPSDQSLLSAVSPEVMEISENKVLNNVVRFLDDNKLTSTETLYSFLRQQKSERPQVEVSKLFLEEYPEISEYGEKRTTLREKVVRKIDDSLPDIAKAAYREKFEEDKRGFVMGFMMGRVIRYDHSSKRMVFDAKEFFELLRYLDANDAALADIEGRTLYSWLYYESRQMARYVEEQRLNVVRYGIRNEITATGVLDRVSGDDVAPMFFEEGFDVKTFHDQHIKPALFKFHSKKLQSLKRVREVDLFRGLKDTVNLGVANYTQQLKNYVRALLKLNDTDPVQSKARVRELLGLKSSPLIDNMTDDEVMKHCQYFLEQVEAKFYTVVKDSLFFREDPEIYDACRYPREILGCRDPEQLMQWFVYPQRFHEQFPHYAKITIGQISFMAGTMLRDLIIMMGKMSDRVFLEAPMRRNMVERDMEQELDLEVLKTKDLSFRLLEEVDEAGEPKEPRVYQTIIDANEVREFVNGQDDRLSRKVMNSPNMALVSHEGKWYRVFPEETKKFKKVRMKIPVNYWDAKKGVFVAGEPFVTEALIYAGDDHFIHSKEALTRMISEDRGKEVSDETRWLLCFSDPAGQEAFKNYLFSRNPTGLIKLEDVSEGRALSNKKNGGNARTVSTEGFKKTQDFIHVLEMSYASIKRPDEQIFEVEKVSLETQCQRLPELLKGNLSKFSRTSHDIYRSQRAWPLLFNHFFPPEYFGDRYEKLKLEGPKN